MKIDLSCYHWAEQLDRSKMPRLSFDCGTEDFLLEENRAFHTFLESIDLPHHYAEHPGAHTWEYWDAHVVTALAQHAEVLGTRVFIDLAGRLAGKSALQQFAHGSGSAWKAKLEPEVVQGPQLVMFEHDLQAFFSVHSSTHRDLLRNDDHAC